MISGNNGMKIKAILIPIKNIPVISNPKEFGKCSISDGPNKSKDMVAKKNAIDVKYLI